MHCRKANIFVTLLAPARSAWVDHSPYQSAKRRVPIFMVCIFCAEMSSRSMGMKCDLKSALKRVQVPKSGVKRPRAFFCLSFAHSPAGVPILKWVRAAATFLLSEGKRSWFR